MTTRKSSPRSAHDNRIYHRSHTLPRFNRNRSKFNHMTLSCCIRTAMYKVLVFAVLPTAVLTGCQNLGQLHKNTAAAGAPGSGELTVMSYNIRVGYGGHDRGVNPYILVQRKENLPPIIAAIRSIDPDVIGLQEVRGYRQARRLADALDMYYAFAWHDTDRAIDRWWGIAVLSKYPIAKADRFYVRSERGNVKSVLICTVVIGGQPTNFFSIHTARDLTDRSSLGDIMEVAGSIEEPIVLIGDLNMTPDDRRLDLLLPRFVDSAKHADTSSALHARSTGTFLGVGRIDYVLVDQHYFNVLDAGIISSDHWHASDHLAYYAKIVRKTSP